MRTVQLGKTSEKVSAICLGTDHFVEEATAFPLLDYYADAGGCFLDTANIYGKHFSGHFGGEVEELLGRWMRSRKNRGKMFVATKVAVAYPLADGQPAVEMGVSRQQLIAECDKSLKRLRVDTIDLYYIHTDLRLNPMVEVMETLHDLVRSGKVRFLGASNHAAWRLEEARGICQQRNLSEFCCVQERHTYLRPKRGAVFPDTRYADDETKDWCKTHGVTPIAFSPLIKGAYSRPDRAIPEQYAGPDSDIRLRVLREIAGELNCTPNQVVLAWMLRSDPSFIPLIGASKTAQIQENIAALQVRLSDAQMNRLDSASM